MKPCIAVLLAGALCCGAADFAGSVIDYAHYACNPYADSNCKAYASSRVVTQGNGDTIRHDKRAGSIRTVKTEAGRQTTLLHEVKMQYTLQTHSSLPVLSPADHCKSPLDRFVKESKHLGIPVYYLVTELPNVTIDEWRAPSARCQALATRIMPRGSGAAAPQVIIATSVKLGPVPAQEWKLPPFPEADPLEMDRALHVRAGVKRGLSQAAAEQDYDAALKAGHRRDYQELSRRWKESH